MSKETMQLENAHENLASVSAEVPVMASSGQVFEMDDDLIFDSALATMQVSVSVC